MRNARRLQLAVIMGAGTLALTACGEGDSAEAEDDLGTVTIGYVAWDEVMAATYLWEHILEEQGADVELLQLEPAAVYADVADGEADLFMGGLQGTHASYWDTYGDDFEIVATWHEPLLHGLAVPQFVEAESIEDLEGNADEVGGRIVGIEAGSGLMDELGEAEEAYDLGDFDIVEGSTAAMLAEFQGSVADEEPVVVTAWAPHWAVEEYDMKFLDDPEGVFTDDDQYHVIASDEAQENEPLMTLLEDFALDDELFSLLNEIHAADSDEESQAVEQWLETDEHRALVEEWTGTQ